MLVNGDFEALTVAPGCYYNLSNAEVDASLSGIAAYGPAQEIDVMGDGSACIFGLPPQSGNVKLAIHKQSTGASDEFAFVLTSPVVAGQVYDVSCYAAADVTFDPNIGAVDIGVSNTPTSFGTLVFSNSPNIGTWTPLLHTFVAPVSGNFLTVRVGGPVQSWVHVDHFVLTPGGPVPTLRKNWAAVKASYR